MRQRSRSWLVAVLTVLSVVGVSACGSSSSSSGSATPTTGSTPAATTSSTATTASTPASTTSTTSTTASADSTVEALVPAAIKSKGTITVAADASYAPNEFFASDGKTVIGMDADLSKALGAVMGLKVSVVNATFDSIIPDLSSGKFDMGASSFTDTLAREKQVNFVDYFQAGTSFFTKASGGADVTDLASLCGKTVSVESGTTEESDAQAQSKKCKGSKVTVLTFPTQSGANLALNSGRAQVSMADSPVAAYQVKQSNGAFKLVGQTYGTAPYGLAFPKTSKLDTAVLAALKVLMANGTYTHILTTWGVQSGALPAADVKINGATS